MKGRFDDVARGSALAFDDPFRVLVAREPADVAPLLEEVDRATAAGCWAFGYLAYEAAPGLDPGLAVAPRDAGDPLPLAVFGLCHRPVAAPPVTPPPGSRRDYAVGPWKPSWTESEHRAAVTGVQKSIAAGETYQLNLTLRLRAAVTGDPAQLYADLAWAQRGSYAAYLDLDRHVVASASPELFFEWAGDRLLTRPMKGTASRGRTAAEDEERRTVLLASEKERSENVMIVDLLRNDLGRIAEVGSVQVPVLCRPERYETVWQLTSDVTARPRPGAGLVDVFRALFPSGSVTGAPKQRTMELIRELESEPRGVYCGAIGVVAPPGRRWRARFSVAIRTVTLDRTTGTAVFGTGGGITWSSDPAAEHAELLAKAAILAEPYEEFALIETMAHLPGGGLRDLDRHLARLADSAAHFGFRLDPAGLRARLATEVAGAGPARVRVLLHRRGRVEVDLGPLPPPAAAPARLAVDPEPVDGDQVWRRHKTTRREVFRVRAERHADADDVVLVNRQGRVTETTIANLAVCLDGQWWTPPLTAGCLPGVARARLLEAGQLAERELTPADLRRADGLAVVSSLRGWRDAVLL